MVTKHVLCYKNFLKIKSYQRNKIKTKEHNNGQNVNICIRNLDTLTNRNRKQLNIFERKVYRRILGPVYNNEKENWRILTNKEIYAHVKEPTIMETKRLNRLRWFGHVQRMEENRIPKKLLHIILVATGLRSRPRNRWQDEVREDGTLFGWKRVGGKGIY